MSKPSHTVPPTAVIDAAVRALVETVEYVDAVTFEPLHGPGEMPTVPGQEDDE